MCSTAGFLSVVFPLSAPLSLWLFTHFTLGQTVTVLNGPVLAEDKDIGANAVVKYRLLGDRMNFFTVDADTGNIASPLQMEISLQQQCSHFFVSDCPLRCDTCASGGHVGPRGLSRASS